MACSVRISSAGTPASLITSYSSGSRSMPSTRTERTHVRWLSPGVVELDPARGGPS